MSTLAAYCLAAVIFAEARGEPILGQVAVAHVVLNRAQHDPDRICETTQRPWQFAIRRPTADFVLLATELLENPGEDPTLGATHFHSGEAPWWASYMHPTARIGGHRFYVDASRMP
jgi:N-acetylmuramoyl-L-alanine amidase